MTRLEAIKRAFTPNSFSTMPHQVPPAEQAKAVRFAYAYDTATAAYLWGVSTSRVCVWMREAGVTPHRLSWGSRPARTHRRIEYRRAA